MVDREVFDRRLAKLEDLLRLLRGLAAIEPEAFRSDRRLQACAERWLQLSAECALDLAHHLIADRGWKTPTTYREAFQVLATEHVLTAERARLSETYLPASTWILLRCSTSASIFALTPSSP